MTAAIAEDVLAARRQAGEALRAAREAAGRNVDELAAQLKVAPAKIAALESGDWSSLPDETFARALLRSSCKALKTDPAPLLALLPGAPVVVNPVEAAQAEASGVTMVPERPLPRGASSGGRSRGLWWLAVLLVAIAAAVYFWPEYGPLVGGAIHVGQRGHGAGQVAEPIEPHAAASGVPPIASAPAPAPSAPPASAAASPVAAPSAPAPSPSAPGASGASLQLRSTAPSWVEVKSNDGKVVFSQTLQPGAPQTLSIPAASAPLSVVVGNAPQTTVVFAGKTIDLAPRTRANVARLTLP